jgi:hypothetical protein
MGAVLAVLAGGGCGSDGAAADGGTANMGVGGSGASPAGLSCSDLFDGNQVRTYSFEISPTEWNSMLAEFNDLTDLAAGLSFATYHPIVLRVNGETVTNAAIKLHGQSSWLQAVMFDGDRAKMQFDLSFQRTDPNARFHGVGKVTFDMPRSDWTFMHDRLAHTWLRQVGIMAGCTASARVEINGTYYGLYVVEEEVGRRVVQEFFPGNAMGDLWKGGIVPETNSAAPDWNRQQQFWNAGDLKALTAIVDLKSSLTSWAAEALLNDADGYYGGAHNFYVYDQGAGGYVFLPSDTDSTFDWLATFDLAAFDDHPIFFWQTRAAPAPDAGPAWMIAFNDAGWRKKYADAIAALLARWDVGQIQGWIDTWSQQIGPDMAADPHAWATPDEFQKAVSTSRDIVQKRAVYLQTFVDCENGNGADADGDGYRWCDDCRDDDSNIHLGATEVCNGIDDNCNGAVDEGCP